MADTYTRLLVLFAAVEVKMEGGSDIEAKAQLAVNLASGLRCRKDLADAAGGKAAIAAVADLPMMAWTVIGHQWNVYLGFVDSDSVDDRIVRILLLLPNTLSSKANFCPSGSLVQSRILPLVRELTMGSSYLRH